MLTLVFSTAITFLLLLFFYITTRSGMEATLFLLPFGYVYLCC